MEERIINILVNFNVDIGGLMKSVDGFKAGQESIEDRLTSVEDVVTELKADVAVLKSDVSVFKNDMSSAKLTVNALSSALLDTSREVRQLKTKS